jgi:dipeptidyl aminopeptidase/acylaminoacyl peptidase
MYDLASPIQHVSAASQPTLLFHGEHDWIVTVASARRLYHALAAAARPVVYVEFPRTVHGFDLLFPGLSPAAQATLYDLERFLTCVVMEDGQRMPRP